MKTGSGRMAVFGNLESMQPIKIGPGLIGYLERLKKTQLLTDWQDALGTNGPE